MSDRTDKLRSIITLDSELNKLQDVDILLERILYEARSVVNADAGSIYIVEKDSLIISYAQNDTKQAELPPGQKLIYKVFTIPISAQTISGYCALTGEPVNVSDVYQIPQGAPYGFDPSYDVAAGYRTHSVLAIPLKTNTGEILGVIQVINKLDGKGNVSEFNRDDELMVMHFATNATVALQRAQMTRAILLRMIKMAELRDPKETGPHVNRVAGYSVEIYEAWANKIGLPRKQIEKNRDTLRMAAMLHDVGKVSISDTILKKPGRLSDEEFAIMKTHTWQGARLFSNKQSEFDELAQVVALHHHEAWDGSGYPGHVDIETGEPLKTDSQGRPIGKKGTEIPIFGRIVTIADVFDALTSNRAYKDSWSQDDAVGELVRLKGIKFDPELVDIFVAILPNIRTITERYQHSAETENQ